MELSNYDLKMFEQAKIEAESSDYKPFKLGCVIAYKGHIIGRGHNSNKSHPMQKKYNRKYRHFNCERGEFVHDSVHAEVSAITDVRWAVGKDVDWSKASIYVFRISHGRSTGFGCAKPCPACLGMIRDVGIKRIFYTDNEGYSYLELR